MSHIWSFVKGSALGRGFYGPQTQCRFAKTTGNAQKPSKMHDTTRNIPKFQFTITRVQLHRFSPRWQIQAYVYKTDWNNNHLVQIPMQSVQISAALPTKRKVTLFQIWPPADLTWWATLWSAQTPLSTTPLGSSLPTLLNQENQRHSQFKIGTCAWVLHYIGGSGVEPWAVRRSRCWGSIVFLSVLTVSEYFLFIWRGFSNSVVNLGKDPMNSFTQCSPPVQSFEKIFKSALLHTPQTDL